jgi:hypothetical protein
MNRDFQGLTSIRTESEQKPFGSIRDEILNEQKNIHDFLPLEPNY